MSPKAFTYSIKFFFFRIQSLNIKFPVIGPKVIKCSLQIKLENQSIYSDIELKWTLSILSSSSITFFNISGVLESEVKSFP